MLVLIIAAVVVGAIVVVGALVGMSVADNHAGDRARRRERQHRLVATGVDARAAGPTPSRTSVRLADVRTAGVTSP